MSKEDKSSHPKRAFIAKAKTICDKIHNVVVDDNLE